MQISFLICLVNNTDPFYFFFFFSSFLFLFFLFLFFFAASREGAEMTRHARQRVRRGRRPNTFISVFKLNLDSFSHGSPCLRKSCTYSNILPYTPLLSVCSTEEWKLDFPTYQSFLCFLCPYLTWNTNPLQFHLTWPNQRGCSNPMHVHRQHASR